MIIDRLAINGYVVLHMVQRLGENGGARTAAAH